MSLKTEAAACRDLMVSAILAERERCAKIADREAKEYQRQIDEHNKQRGQPEHGWMLHGQQSTAANIAALLRLPEVGG